MTKNGQKVEAFDDLPQAEPSDPFLKAQRRIDYVASVRLAYHGLLGPEFYIQVGQEIQALRELPAAEDQREELERVLALIVRGWCRLTLAGRDTAACRAEELQRLVLRLLDKAVRNLEGAYAAVQAAREFLPGGLLRPTDGPVNSSEAMDTAE